MSEKVDSYRFLNFLTRKLVAAWIDQATPQPIPWTPLSKPLADCTVALVSSGGIALKNDTPFDQEGERQNPWWGDPSYRVLPPTATEQDVDVYHLHVDPRPAQQDLNCLFPLQRLLELQKTGEIARSAPRHGSFMGYILQPETLLEKSVPAMIQHFQEDEVDVVILVPA